MRVTISAPVVHRCPYKDEIDYGTTEITFDGDAPELHGVAEYLEALRPKEVTHEEYTRMVRDDLNAARVVTRWRTAGFDVVCEATA